MKKVLSMLLTTALVVSTITGCGGNGEESATGTAGSSKEANTSTAQAANDGSRTEVEFWSWWRAEARKPYIDQMVADFNASQNKYHVTYVVTPWSDIFTKNIAQIAAGNPCDVIVNSMEGLRFRAQEGQVECLDSYVTDEMKYIFYEQTMDACIGEDGKTYAVPLSIDTRVLFYNKEHFKEAGINPEDIKTWADVEQAAMKLDRKSGDKYERIGLMPTMGNGGVTTWMVNANGGPCWFNPETGEVTANSESNKEAFAWIKKQNDRYGEVAINEMTAAFSSGMADPFASGIMSMIVNVSAYVSSLRQTAPDLDYGVIMIPEFKEGNGHVSNGGGFVLEIPKGAKNPEGAFEFIKFVTSKETQDYLSTKIGDFSARADFDETTEFYKQPNVPDLTKALEFTSYIVIPNKLQGYSSVVDPLVDEAVLGLVPTDKALDNIQKALEDFAQNQ